MVEKAPHSRKNKQRDLTRLGLSILLLILCNYVGSFVFKRFDLTSEKRYTLSPESKEIAKNLKSIAFFKVYLNGKLPAGFIRLRDEMKEMLDEFNAYSGGKVQYQFIDPTTLGERKAVFHQLYEQGLEPFNLEVKENSGTAEQIIWPGAILTYAGRDMGINILQTQMDADPETQLNNSIEALEYNIDNAIHKIDIKTRPIVAFLQGHGEPDSLHLAGAINALSEYYDVRLLPINHRINGLQLCKALIIAKPLKPIDDKDAYVIDQFIMRGGKVFWLIDPMYAPMDSLARNGMTISFKNDLNLDDQLFRYGVRLNSNLIEDLQSSAIPLNSAFPGEQPRIQLYPWLFEPLISPSGNNPIVRNLNLVEFKYASTIDTIQQPGIKKTILLTTSKATRLLNAPVRISFDMVRIQPDAKQFNQGFQPVAVLLEGKFTSAFKGRLDINPDTLKMLGYKPDGVNTSMIVVSDGDVIINEVDRNKNEAYPLGYDGYTYKVTQQIYGNKDFIVNCMNYLCGDSALLTVRTKQLKLRLLDRDKAHKYKTQLQITNMVVPIGLIVLLGIALAVLRKRKYAR
ncbi:MAG: gliding motility-associated ABC transporter substrate-binding protein GldG [Bacteroidia bacterium]